MQYDSNKFPGDVAALLICKVQIHQLQLLDFKVCGALVVTWETNIYGEVPGEHPKSSSSHVSSC